MGQQPNIELSASDFPRSGLEPAAARRSNDARPGVITSPRETVAGGAFGRPGPDTGWVLKLVREAEFDRSERGIENLVAAVAAARASAGGRGPSKTDVEVALILLGLRPQGLPEEVAAQLAATRTEYVRRAAHEKTKGQAFLAQLSSGFLTGDPNHVRHLLNVAAHTAAP